MEDRYYLAALLQCRQIGSVRMRRLYAAVSSACAIWSMDVGHLRALGSLSDALVEALVRHIHMHPDLPTLQECRQIVWIFHDDTLLILHKFIADCNRKE